MRSPKQTQIRAIVPNGSCNAFSRAWNWAYRIPQNGNFNEFDYSCAAPPCTLLSTALTTAIPPEGTPTITLSSFNQTWTRNQAELAWDFSKKAGARIGYRYGDRDFNHFIDLLTGDLDHFVGLEQTALFGIWARPIHALRLISIGTHER